MAVGKYAVFCCYLRNIFFIFKLRFLLLTFDYFCLLFLTQTTLMKLISNTIKPQKGEVTTVSSLRMGYFSQHTAGEFTLPFFFSSLLFHFLFLFLSFLFLLNNHFIILLFTQ
jgi:hypothetical protein